MPPLWIAVYYSRGGNACAIARTNVGVDAGTGSRRAAPHDAVARANGSNPDDADSDGANPNSANPNSAYRDSARSIAGTADARPGRAYPGSDATNGGSFELRRIGACARGCHDRRLE